MTLQAPLAFKKKNLFSLQFPRMLRTLRPAWSSTPSARPSPWTAPALRLSAPVVSAAEATSPPTTKRRPTAHPAPRCTPRRAAEPRCTARRRLCTTGRAHRTTAAWRPAMGRTARGPPGVLAPGIPLLGISYYPFIFQQGTLTVSLIFFSPWINI